MCFRTLIWFSITVGILCLLTNLDDVSAQHPDARSSNHTAQQNWPQWRGPNADGVSPNANPPVSWSLTKNLIWKTKVAGQGQGTPIVWGNRIFLQTAIPVDKDLPVPDVIPKGTPNIKVNPQESIERWKPQQFAIVCLDRESGQEIWKRIVLEAMPHQGHHFKGCFAAQSMVTDGKHVIAYFGSYGLYCFDFDGQLIWKKDPKPQAMEAGLGEGSSPALMDNKLVVVVDQESQSYIVAFDSQTGRQLWKQNRDEPSNWSTPRILTFGEKQQVVVNGITVRSYDLNTGQLVWKCGGHTASAIPVPAFGHGMVFNTSGWSKDKLQAIRLGRQGDLTDSDSVRWTLERGTPYVPSPLLLGNELYLLDDRSFFSCFQAVDGKRYYKKRLPGTLNFSASPVAARDRIYLASEEGTTVVVQAGAEAKILAINELDDEFYASPVPLENKIYLRGKKFLYCFGNE